MSLLLSALPTGFMCFNPTPLCARNSAVPEHAAYTVANKVQWRDHCVNLGSINEDDGKREGYVTFLNAGDAPVMIDRVKPACGCTGVSFPADPVNPGDSASIRLTYNPLGRPGRFDKVVKVYFVGEEEPETVRICGYVIPSDETLQYNFPDECGPLRLSSTMLTPEGVRRGTTRRMFVNLYNQSEAPLTPAVSSSSPDISASLSPEQLAPGETATLIITLNPAKDSSTGDMSRSVTLTPDTRIPQEAVTVNILATVTD